MVQAVESARSRHLQVVGGRVPPHNLEAEESLLGAMLLRRDAIAAGVERCTAEDFYKPAHAHIFDAVTSLYAKGEPADPVTVADELRRTGLLEAVGDPSLLISLQVNTPSTANAAHYARIVEEHALLRRLVAVAGEIAELGYSVPEDVSAVVDRAEAMVFEVAQRRMVDTMSPLRDLLAASLDHSSSLYAPRGHDHRRPDRLRRPRRAARRAAELQPRRGRRPPVHGQDELRARAWSRTRPCTPACPCCSSRSR